MFLPSLSFIPRIRLPLGTYLLIVIPLCLGPIIALAFFDFSTRRAERLKPRGCRKIGLRGESRLADEFDTKYAEGSDAGKDENGNDRWRVKSLWIYPVKSCRGVELNRGEVIKTGMEYDRQFSFAQLLSPFPVSEKTPLREKSEHKWDFITQRKHPRLATIETEVWVPDPSSTTYSAKHADVQSGGVLIISYPYQEDGWKGIVSSWTAARRGTVPRKSFRVPLDPTPQQIERNGYTKENMTIWKDAPPAINMEVHVPLELSYVLGVSNRLSLFRVHHGHEREVFRCAPTKEQLGFQPITGFADAYPLHILNLASVHDVARRLSGVSLSAIRFRPNIFITGPRKYEEDSWKKIRIGDYEYFVVCRTARCKLPNNDPVTGISHPSEPDRTLRSFRRIDKGTAANACLGMQMVPASEKSQIRVGDPIEVLETGDHFYMKQ